MQHRCFDICGCIEKYINKYGENNAANMLLLTHAAPFSEIRDVKPAASGLEAMSWPVESMGDFWWNLSRDKLVVSSNDLRQESHWNAKIVERKKKMCRQSRFCLRQIPAPRAKGSDRHKWLPQIPQRWEMLEWGARECREAWVLLAPAFSNWGGWRGWEQVLSEFFVLELRLWWHLSHGQEGKSTLKLGPRAFQILFGRFFPSEGFSPFAEICLQKKWWN